MYELYYFNYRNACRNFVPELNIQVVMSTQKVFIINAGQIFGHSGGQFNKTLFDNSIRFFTQRGFEVRTTDINETYDPVEEVAKYVWADVVIYHTPIWWFQVPHAFKQYIDVVFTEGGDHRGIYHSDGRSSANPAINYGTGGMLHGKKYLVTTSWNAPATAFTLPGEFFNERSVDDGILFGFHRMNAFIGMERLESLHFHDVMKNADIPYELERYEKHLEQVFIPEKTEA